MCIKCFIDVYLFNLFNTIQIKFLKTIKTIPKRNELREEKKQNRKYEINDSEKKKNNY